MIGPPLCIYISHIHERPIFWSLATNLGTTFKAPTNLGALAPGLFSSSLQLSLTLVPDPQASRMGKHKQVACQICFNFMRSDHVKGHMQVHQKYSPTNDTPQSAEDICRDLVLEIVGKVVAPVEETSRIKRKHVEVECKA